MQKHVLSTKHEHTQVVKYREVKLAEGDILYSRTHAGYGKFKIIFKCKY